MSELIHYFVFSLWQLKRTQTGPLKCSLIPTGRSRWNIAQVMVSNNQYIDQSIYIFRICGGSMSAPYYFFKCEIYNRKYKIVMPVINGSIIFICHRIKLVSDTFFNIQSFVSDPEVISFSWFCTDEFPNLSKWLGKWHQWMLVENGIWICCLCSLSCFRFPNSLSFGKTNNTDNHRYR